MGFCEFSLIDIRERSQRHMSFAVSTCPSYPKLITNFLYVLLLSHCITLVYSTIEFTRLVVSKFVFFAIWYAYQSAYNELAPRRAGLTRLQRLNGLLNACRVSMELIRRTFVP
jgi:hypothetical protein